jgi:hypothetical protein
MPRCWTRAGAVTALVFIDTNNSLLLEAGKASLVPVSMENGIVILCAGMTRDGRLTDRNILRTERVLAI